MLIMNDSLQTLVGFYESISAQTLPQLRALYTPDAYFKDPFNEVRDIEAIEKIFAHMFVSLIEPRFVVHTKIAHDGEAFLAWEFTFRIRRFKPGIEQCIRGASHLKFDATGRVGFHRDYWDAAEELYEKLPIAGALIRFLKKRIA
jgi:steroid Delta-isomerase